MGLVASKRTQGIIYGALALVWIALDQVTKAYFASTYALGQSSQGSWVLFDFQLVHNKGAAWGMFSDSTFALGVMSLVVCALVTGCLVAFERIA